MSDELCQVAAAMAIPSLMRYRLRLCRRFDPVTSETLPGVFHRPSFAAVVWKYLRNLRPGHLALVCGMLFLAVPVHADQAADDFNVAVGAYRSGRWELAAETFGEFLKEYPEHPRRSLARLYLGLSLSSMERYGDARLQFKEYLDLEPQSSQAADARYRLGECSYYLKEYETASVQLQKYLELHAGHSLHDWGKLFLADSLQELGRSSEAEVLLRELLAGAPDAVVLREAQFGMGRVLEHQKKPDEALEFYRLVADDTKSAMAPRAQARIGTVFFNQQRYEEASAAYDQVVKRFPATSISVSARYNSGLALYRAKKYEAAVLTFNELPRDSANISQALLMKAVSLRELTRFDEAREAFSAAGESAGDKPIAIEILLQLAQLERTQQQLNEAVRIYETIAERWPREAQAADCLFNACELRVDLKEIEQAELIWRKLVAEYPASAAGVREQVLLGRILLLKGDTDGAVAVLQGVSGSGVQLSAENRTPVIGRYYLVRAFYEAEKFREAADAARSLTVLLKDPSLQELRGVLALAATSSLQTGEFTDARMFADEYLATSADADQRADVTATRAVALTRLKLHSQAMADVAELSGKYAARPQSWSAILMAAEAADEMGILAEASELFGVAAKNDSDPVVKEAGMTGVAWSQFKARQYAEAEASFGLLISAFPESKNIAQNLYMQGRCVEEQEMPEKAAGVYRSVFQTLTSTSGAVPPGAETEPPMQYAFDAGRQAARLFGNLKQLEAANEQWGQLVTRFPAAVSLDRVLEEWAWLNLNAENYEISDRIYRQLIDQFPTSPFAGQARLSLAESEMQAGRLETAQKEFEAIAVDPSCSESEKERANFHLLDIFTVRRDWQQVRRAADEFQMRYPESPLIYQVKLLAGESALNLATKQAEFESAEQQLASLRDGVTAGKAGSDEWTERVWVVLAEAALAAGEYARIDLIDQELMSRSPETRFRYQLDDIQGRRWKIQAPPDFEKSREYFRSVIDDSTGKGTETAARCQFLIAETLIMQENPGEARKEYYKVYLSYQYAPLRAQSLYQMAQCEIRLDKKADAIRSFNDLIREFPDTDVARMATEELKKLTGNTE